MLLEFIKQFFLQIILVSLLGYLIGSISFPIIVTRIFNKNQDIRTVGSGNAGFTNVLRSVGVVPAIITFLGDFLKCSLAIFIAKIIFSYCSLTTIDQPYISQYGAYIAGFFCVIGHIYPCFFNFRGGKSIVSAFSMMMATHWQVGLIILAIFLVVLFISKIVSLGSITCAFLYPLVNFLTLKFCVLKNSKDQFSINYITFTTIVAFLVMAIVIYKHKGNITRLLNGTEKKISLTKNSHTAKK